MSASLILHTKQFGFKHGEALLMADSWRGPYRLSDSNARWRGSTANAEGSWHQLVEGNPMPGGHAWSADGTAWSNITLRALGGAAAVRTAAAANSANTGGGAATVARGAAAAVSASTG